VRVVRAGLLVTLCLALGACTGDAPPPDTTPSATAPPQTDRDRLAGLVASAKDRRYLATYTLQAPNRPDRIVTVAYGVDGSWVVSIPGGAWSGLADIAMFADPGGQRYECVIGWAVGAAGQRSDLVLHPGCTKIDTLAKTTDPSLHHVFFDSIDPLLDRGSALSVAATAALPDTTGSCFSVESTSAALAPPVLTGTYCYRADGILTGARVKVGTLTLASVADAPPSVAMPAPAVTATPLPLVAPSAPPVQSAAALPARS
jgi:hypothetical protein